jgi:hypothetical protein
VQKISEAKMNLPSELFTPISEDTRVFKYTLLVVNLLNYIAQVKALP